MNLERHFCFMVSGVPRWDSGLENHEPRPLGPGTTLPERGSVARTFATGCSKRRIMRSESKLSLVRSPRGEAPDDTTLALGAARGDPGAAGMVWDRYAALVRGVLRRSLGHRDVDDHVQEVFLRFHRRAAELRDPSALRCFLIGIAMRVAGSELRRRRVRRLFLMTPPEEMRERVTPPLDAGAREALLRLYGILDRLDADSQLLFTMRYVERLELTDLAAVFGVSLATIKRRLSRVSERVFTMARRDESLVGYLKDERAELRGAE